MPTETKRPHIVRSFLLAPQTEIPLTGEMSRSDKRVTAWYEQLEPVDDVVVQKKHKLRCSRTCDRSEILSCNCPWSGRCTLYFFLLTAPLFLPPAAGLGEPVNSRVTLLQYGVAGERTVQRCRQKQKDRTSCDLFVWKK